MWSSSPASEHLERSGADLAHHPSYLRQQCATLEIQNHLAELKLRAERKSGRDCSARRCPNVT